MQAKLIILISIVLFIHFPVFALEDDGYEGYFESINEAVNTSGVMSLIGSTADEMLYKIKDAIVPGIVRLSNPDANESGKYSIRIAAPSSFIGALISVLLTLECVVLGIKSFIGENHSAQNLLRHFLMLCILLAFIALLPIIAESILRILVNAASVVGGADKGNGIISFKPSSVIELLEACKIVIDEKRAALGGLSIGRLSLLPDILTLYFTSFIISIPYVVISICVIFWYVEFYIIILAGVISLPFSFFTYTSITDMKSILKALLLVGMKIFLCVAIGVLSSQVIMEQLENSNNSIGGTINLIVYILLMTVFFVFGVIKGPVIFMSALSASVASPSGGSFLIGKFTSHVKRPFSHKKASGENHKTPPSTKGSGGEEAPVEENSVNQTPPPLPPSKTLASNIRDKEITSNATAERMNRAYEKFQSEGVKYVSVERVQERARWEATYDKLSQMKQYGFVDNNGVFNSSAAAQYARMTRDKGDYIKGNTTWDGVKKQ